MESSTVNKTKEDVLEGATGLCLDFLGMKTEHIRGREWEERHLKNNAIIRHSQHGLTKGKSCSTNLISYDKFTCLVDEGKEVDVVFLDFSKAFDTVLYSILLDKLSSCGMSRFTVCWVKKWLDSRAQRVVVNGATSGW
ncbi:hypothetical protein QYF61_001395 [Mycteria americana]|uniref:Rna-directed dna polymerase from mobile element jockey-like n=1 Tax=Mycteria americana TaxID=33587 RepID=A0AAN7NGI7_MYCAM|nr:hypothetical protein QYF61_001395 [Mycteria americana]